MPRVEMQDWLATVRATQTTSWSGSGTLTAGDCTRSTTANGSEDVAFDTTRSARVTAQHIGPVIGFGGSVPVRGELRRHARATDRYDCPEGSAEFEGATSGCGTHSFGGVASVALNTRTRRLTVILQPTGVAALEFCKPAFGTLFPGLLPAEATLRPAVLFGDADVLRFRGRDSETTNTTQLHLRIRTSTSVTWDVELFPTAGDPLAVPGRYAAVKRGGTVRLDGSRSRARRGRITRYRWTFAPGAGCPPGTQLRRSVKTTARTSVKLLCPLVATLEVTDSRGRTDARSTRLGVNARTGVPWKTPFSHRQALATAARGPIDPPAVISAPGGGVAVSLTGGVNTTDCGEEAPGSMILCPAIGGQGSWRGRGYELTRLSDPGGPFDRFWWVSGATLDVKRVALINPTLTPGVAVLPNRGSFFDENAARGNPVAAFLQAVEQHEGFGAPGVADSGHTQIIKRLVTGDLDPRRRIETLFAGDESAAQRDIDKALHEIDAEVDTASNDPLTRIFNGGPLAFWNERTGTWEQTPTFHVP